MIEECNFKFVLDEEYTECELGLKKECSGENNCILYQIYKENYVVRETRTPVDDEFVRILCDYHGHMAVRKKEYDGKCPHCDRTVVKW